MEVKKTDKANIQKSSMIFFLIGLNIVLAVVLALFNYKHYDKPLVAVEEMEDAPPPTTAVLIDIPLPKTPPPPPPKADEPPPPPPPVVPQEIEMTKEPVEPPPIKNQNDLTPPEIPTSTGPVGPVKQVDLTSLTKSTKVVEERVAKPVTVNRVAEMAIYPGCDEFKGKKRELIKCFSEKFGQDILRYLDAEFPDVDKQFVSVRLEFHVDQKGNITNINPKYGDEIFKPEAKRALEKTAEYLRRKGEHIQPAKMDDGTNAVLIFTQDVKLTNPNY